MDLSSNQARTIAREPVGERTIGPGGFSLPVTEVFAAITVRDRDAAIEYYERLLGAAPTMLPNDDEAAWQLSGGGWLYVLRDAERRAGRW